MSRKQEQYVAPESIIGKTTNYSSAVISLLHEPIERRLMCRICSRSWFKVM